MNLIGAPGVRAALASTGLAVALAVPIVLAATSPLLAWRDPVYIAAGLAGVVGMALMLIQPLLAGGYLPGLPGPRGRRVHRVTGAALVAAVIVHVAALWITSPPDVIDALLFVSPTPFAIWGVIAMWAVLASALLAALRRRLRLRPQTWRRVHSALAAVIVAGTVAHALLIEGTMEPVSKAILGVLIVAATLWVIRGLRRRQTRPT
jgi:predicted ferric reductase